MSSNKIEYETLANLRVERQFSKFVHDELLQPLGVAADGFWLGVADIISTLAPINKHLLDKREKLQHAIDDWHETRKNKPINFSEYKAFLTEIGYLVPPSEPFTIDTENIDPEIATLAGPQLVVPLMNARFALNACNARWGSLYDALYGTDVIEPPSGDQKGYDKKRGEKVVAYGRSFLNNTFPLQKGSFEQVTNISLEQGSLIMTLNSGETTRLINDKQFKGASEGYLDRQDSAGVILLVNNGLHVEIVIDKSSAIGAADLAGISDIVLESALTTIMDCEDSIAAVDAEDKIQVYRNWLGLMAGTLEEEVMKNGKTFTRRMHLDRDYMGANGEPLSLPGRSLLFVRNVGHLMTSNIILDAEGNPIPEGILDAIFTCLASIPDSVGAEYGIGSGENHGNRYDKKNPSITNSKIGSIYIVKPKMHGPEEVAFTEQLFTLVEELLDFPKNTVKMGIMDEERRTSVNLVECIRAAKSRVVFINTGFLDRTGDEIHTSMQAGAFLPKEKIKTMPWINAYEKSNVAAGLLCGLKGKAQIGKGMWAMPDNMADMMAKKIGQPQSGASTAWVPSPTASTLHAMHYHVVNVASMQDNLAKTKDIDIDTILQIPLYTTDGSGEKSIDTLTEDDIHHELENNVQGILGYVVRWIEQGIGCSKVPDINNIGLMEDRATLRISSQHIANWLYHGICSPEQVLDVLTAMATVVDEQNRTDKNYTPMSPRLDSCIAFKAAKDLIFKGLMQPSGYTEPLLHAYRVRYKQQSSAHK